MTHKKPTKNFKKQSLPLEKTKKQSFYERFRENHPKLLHSMKVSLVALTGAAAVTFADEYVSNIRIILLVKEILKRTKDRIVLKIINDSYDTISFAVVISIKDMRSFLLDSLQSKIQIYHPRKSTHKLSTDDITSLIGYLIPEQIEVEGGGLVDIASLYLIDPEDRAKKNYFSKKTESDSNDDDFQSIKDSFDELLELSKGLAEKDLQDNLLELISSDLNKPTLMRPLIRKLIKVFHPDKDKGKKYDIRIAQLLNVISVSLKNLSKYQFGSTPYMKQRALLAISSP